MKEDLPQNKPSPNPQIQSSNDDHFCPSESCQLQNSELAAGGRWQSAEHQAMMRFSPVLTVMARERLRERASWWLDGWH